MSVSRGKSSFGEEKVLLARKRSFPRGNTLHWRGTMHPGEERRRRSGNDAEGSAQLFHQSGSFVRRWVMRASRDGSMMAIVQQW